MHCRWSIKLDLVFTIGSCWIILNTQMEAGVGIEPASTALQATNMLIYSMGYKTQPPG